DRSRSLPPHRPNREPCFLSVSSGGLRRCPTQSSTLGVIYASNATTPPIWGLCQAQTKGQNWQRDRPQPFVNSTAPIPQIGSAHSKTPAQLGARHGPFIIAATFGDFPQRVADPASTELHTWAAP